MRVSSQQLYNNFVNNNRIRNQQLEQSSMKMSNQRRYQNIGEDPQSSANSSYYQGRIQRYQQYADNGSFAVGRYQLAENLISQTIEALQNVRELTVQAANGTNNIDDNQQTARVINELLEQVLTFANSRDEQGNALFSGNQVKQQAFLADRAYQPELGRQAIQNVSYSGDHNERDVEIEDGVYIPVNFAGNRLFWAGQHQLIGGLPADNFRVLAPQQIIIDGQTIDLEIGDNIASIVDKINNSGLALRASQDEITQAMVIRTTIPHQMQLEQPEGSQVLQDLGLLAAGNRSLDEGAHPDALQSSTSLFAAIIQLRDSLIKGDQELIGSRDLAGIEQSLATLINNRTDLGARSHRLQVQQSYGEQAVEEYQQLESNENDLDASAAISEMNKLILTQQAIYQTVARLGNLNLMNYLNS